MQRYTCLIAVSVIALTTGTAVGEDVRCGSTDACLRAIEAAQRSTRVLSARFEQTKHLSLLAEPLVSHGTFAFKQPDEVLWHLDAPPLTVHIDRQGVRVPDQPGVQADIAALAPFSKILRELSGMFTGSFGHVQNAFDVRAESDAAGIRVHLVPRDTQAREIFASVDLTFGAPDLVIQRIGIEEALGDRLVIVFSDVHRNDAIADGVFASVGRERP